MRRNDTLWPLVALVLLGGCKGSRRVDGPDLETMVPLVAAQIGETLLGIPSRSLTTPGEPAILGTAGKTRVVLAADEATFVEIIGQGARPQDIRAVVGKISTELNRSLRRRKFESVASSFPPTCAEPEALRTVLVSIRPYTLETGGPQEKASGKNATLVMARMALTDAKTGQSLGIREFYSGYSLVKPRAAR